MNLDAAISAIPSLTHDTPRERALEGGVGALGDAELLAILLGTGLAGRPVSLVAAGLLDRTAGLEGLARLGPSALAEHPGVGEVKAARIAAAIEIGRRAAIRSARARPPLRSPAEVAAYVKPMLRGLDHEEMWVLALDGRNNMRGMRKVAQGGLHGCSVAPRDILRVALADAASSMVLAHNHPSGDPTPSPADIEMTRIVLQAGAIAGIPLVDHVIVAHDGRHCSMLEIGLIDRV